MKLKVFHKGLILTGLPLLVELLLITSLLLLLFQSDREKQLEGDYRRYTSLNARMQALATEAPYLLVASFQQDSDKILDQYSADMATLYQCAVQAKKLADTHPERGDSGAIALINKLSVITDKIVAERQKGAHILGVVGQLPGIQSQLIANEDKFSLGLSRLVQEGERLTLETQQRQSRIRNWQTVILSCGLALNIAVAIALSIFYRRAILRRIGIITANTHALSQGRSLSPEMNGGDEIALLDHSFHSMHQQLMEASEREKELFNNASDVICVLDANDRFSKINPVCLRFWGYEASEMIGMSLFDLVADGQRLHTQEQVQVTRVSKQPVSFENILKSKSGEAIEALWSAYWSDREKSLFCIVHDLTERKQVERARQQFLAMVSSDLKRPLSSISAAVSMLVTEHLCSLPEKAAGKLDIVRKNVQRLLGLVNDLLQLSEMDLGNIEIKKETSKIDEILHRSVQDVEAVAEKQKVKLLVQAAAGDWFVDPNRIMQVLVNLLSNAIKFSPEESTVLLVAEPQGDYILCKVIDRGRGVPEAHKQAIFEKFKQVEASDGKRKSGTGLGLPICKQIIEEHGGAIGVDSLEGQGSTFWFRLPKDETAGMKIKARHESAGSAELEERAHMELSSKPTMLEMPAHQNRKQPSGRSRLNLTMKGAFLVGVPVAFELLFVGALTMVLQQVDRDRAVELHQRMIAFDATKLMSDHFQAAMDIGNSKSLKDWLEVKRLKKETIRTTAELLELVKADPVTLKHMVRVVEQQDKLQPFFQYAEKVMDENHNDPSFLHRALADRDKQLFLIIGVARRIQKVIDDAEKVEMQRPDNEKNLRWRQYQVLVGGLAANVLASLLLTVYFSKDITGRLMVLADNADRLAEEKPLNEELEGSDEITNLVRIFHHTADVLSEARQKERAVFDNSQDVICAIAANGAFSSINPACEKVWGYSKEDMRSRTVLDLTCPEDRELTTSTLLGDFGTQQHINFESRIVKKDLSEMYVLWSASRAQEQSTTFCIVHDISAKKELERLKQEFLAMVSHDLRTPLTSITGIAKLILAGAFGGVSGQPRDILYGITESGDRLLELINDLLDIEKLEAGKMRLVLDYNRLDELIEKSVSACHSPGSVKVLLAVGCSELSLECDRDRIIQALTNVINFALSRSPSDKPVELTARCHSHSLEISIKDRGPEIPVQIQTHLFERFKSSSALNSGGSGLSGESLNTGLALPIARKVIAGHGGEIRLQSSDCGFVFVVSLPAGTRADS